ncbi:MAG TPA: GIY-YIG nuclease family protein [Candidatus Paceibacterota bacterium]|nr:MAG: hypothetical protein B7X03_01480 [Parcubacteria group bacterium 21-58-10]HQT82649.1 GIY-YIG nuclease family protein [Candidatus Paceibacterota bacterium]
MHFVYILRSLKFHRYYIGSSRDVDERLSMHNYGSTRSTKPYRPWVIIYTESFPTKSAAEKREWFLKHPLGWLEKKRIIAQYDRNGDVG